MDIGRLAGNDRYMVNPVLLTPARAAVEPLLAGTDGRLLVGLTGPPAAGKSTLAVALAAALCDTLGPGGAVAVQMDGFHLANAELRRLGLADRKGAPETFDVAGFRHLLARLRDQADAIVYAPRYSRTVHESIGSAVPITGLTRAVVVEGNYLLHTDGGWKDVRPLLDFVIYLDAPANSRHAALVRRQQSRGLSTTEARAWVDGSDARNAALIAATRGRADLVLTRG